MASVSRELVREFFQARLSHDPERIAAFLDDEVEWSVSGPVDVLPFCGQRRGKREVIDTIVRQGLPALTVVGIALDEILIDGDRVATFSRFIARRAATGDAISYRCAQLLHFRNGKVVRFQALIDSFDVVQQVLGQVIAVPPRGPAAGRTSAGEVVAV